jgi:ribosomal protein S12 methylthiotransferase accessory factor
MWTFSQIANYPRIGEKPEWAERLLNDSRIVKEFQLLPRLYDEPFLYSYGVKTAKSYPEQSGTDEAGGMAFDPYLALIKSAGEAAERFSLTQADPAHFDYGRFRDQSPQLRPDEFRFFSNEQLAASCFQCFAWNEDEVFAWTDGTNLISGEPVKLPAQLVYMYENHKNSRLERPLFPVTSTGAACGWTTHDSTLSAMLELLERDAFMVHYLSRTEGLRINLSSSVLLSEIESYLARFNLRLQTYLIQTEFPVCPVLAVITEDYQEDRPSPWMAAGLKCSLDPTRAVIGAIEEACQSRLWLRSTLLNFYMNGGAQTEEMLKDVIVDRALFWSKPERIPDLASFTKSRKVIPFDEIGIDHAESPKDQLATLLNFCEQHGHSVYRCDITAPPVREHGLVVSRVLMPTLQQFYLMEPYLPLASSRWQYVPFELGLSDHKPHQPNTIPHFFL